MIKLIKLNRVVNGVCSYSIDNTNKIRESLYSFISWHLNLLAIFCVFFCCSLWWWFSFQICMTLCCQCCHPIHFFYSNYKHPKYRIRLFVCCCVFFLLNSWKCVAAINPTSSSVLLCAISIFTSKWLSQGLSNKINQPKKQVHMCAQCSFAYCSRYAKWHFHVLPWTLQKNTWIIWIL